MNKTIMMLIVLCLVWFTGPSYAIRDEVREYRQEIYESSEREISQSSTALERKTEDTEKGKSLIDVNGYRVRVEKYFSRPASNQIKTLVLNTREDLNRIDQREWLGTFNKDLPEDLKGIARTMWGSTRGKPEYYLTNVDRIDSCGENYLRVTRDDGWLYQYAIRRDGSGAYIVLFNDEKLIVNDKDKIKHVRRLYSEELNIPGVFERFFPDENGNLVSVWSNPSVRPSLEYERGVDGKIHDNLKFTFKDGTFLSRNRYLINDDGDVLPTGTPISAGNREIIYEASEFGGKTIDIVITPESPEKAEEQFSTE